MARPTIADVARTAGVSVSTVNRVIAGAKNVRTVTIRRVRDAAKQIGFYGLTAIEGRLNAGRPHYRLGILLQQPTRTFYQTLAATMQAAAERVTDCTIDLRLEFLDELSPQAVAGRMLGLGEVCDAVGVVAAVHPLVSAAIETLRGRGVPVFAIISQLAAAGSVHYVGLDHWKVGRTAAWAIEHICAGPGKLGILVGNHRYRCQEMNESGFRSYFREYAPGFELLEPLTTFESSSVAQDVTEQLLRRHPDLVGLYVAGGGISGALIALRGSGLAGKIVAVGYELMDNTRAALLDGTLTVVISHPLGRLCEETIGGMIGALTADRGRENVTRVLSFELHTRENM